MAYLKNAYDEDRLIEQAAAAQNTKPQQTAGAVKAPVYETTQRAVYAPEANDQSGINTDSYYNAVQALSSAGNRPVYTNTYGDRLTELYDQIVNRPKFQYDVNADPLYNSLRDQYTQLGKVAMRDTVAQGAGLTGGYNNTYAQQVGQQTYDAYLQNLTDAIPDLYGQALNQYNSEGDALYKQYGMLGDLAADEYGKYRDSLDDWNYQQEWDYRQQQDALDREFQERQYANSLDQQQWEREFAEKQLAQQYELALMSRSGGGSSGGGRTSGGDEGSYQTAVNFIQEATNAALSAGTTSAMAYVDYARQNNLVDNNTAAIAEAQVKGVGMTEYYRKQAQALGLA